MLPGLGVDRHSWLPWSLIETWAAIVFLIQIKTRLEELKVIVQFVQQI